VLAVQDLNLVDVSICSAHFSVSMLRQWARINLSKGRGFFVIREGGGLQQPTQSGSTAISLRRQTRLGARRAPTGRAPGKRKSPTKSWLGQPGISSGS
jgi:hypothetical protein